jgi:hypothetical protein
MISLLRMLPVALLFLRREPLVLYYERVTRTNQATFTFSALA